MQLYFLSIVGVRNPLSGYFQVFKRDTIEHNVRAFTRRGDGQLLSVTERMLDFDMNRLGRKVLKLERDI